MSYYQKNKREERRNAIGEIYADLKGFFSRAENYLTQENVADFDAEFTRIFDRAKRVMMPEKYETDRESNSRRWERIKTKKGVSVLTQPQINPVQATYQPQPKQYQPQPKPVVNEAEKPLPVAGSEIGYLRQMVDYLQLIIREKDKIISAQGNILNGLRKQGVMC